MLNKKSRFIAVLSLFCIVSTVNCTNNVTNTSVTNKAVLSKVNISGKVEFPNFKIKATINDVAPQATVSLISTTDGETGSQNTTLVTGLTDTNGQFNLNSTAALITGKIYVLEASKRLGGAGNNLLSLRTIVKWNGESFDSITSPGIYINTKTTALSIMSSLGKISATDTIGKMPIVNGALSVADIKDVNNNIIVSAASINTVKGLVDNAFTANIDPVGSVIFSNGSYSLKPGGATSSHPVLGCVGEPGSSGCVAPTPVPSSSGNNGCVGEPESCNPSPSSTPTSTPSTLSVMNAGLEFTNTNPSTNGLWSYGSYAANTYNFTLFDNNLNSYYDGGTKNLQQWNFANWLPPNYPGGSIWHSSYDIPITIENTVTIGAKEFDMGGGNNGDKSVIRWKVPATHAYHIQASFKGIRVNGSRSDVHVVKNSVTALLNGDINGTNTVAYNNTIVLNQNDTIDFVVGSGGDELYNDDTNFNAIITPVDAPVFSTETIPVMNARADFSNTSNPNGVWSYGGYLQNTNTFYIFNNHDVWVDSLSEGQNLDEWFSDNWQTSGYTAGGSIYHSPVNTVSHPGGNEIFEPYDLDLDPSVGYKTVLRWTAPKTKNYHLEATFKSLYDYAIPSVYLSTNSDIHIIHGTNSLYDGFLSLNIGNSYNYSSDITAIQGETIDFVVGNGSDVGLSDETSLNVIITANN